MHTVVPFNPDDVNDMYVGQLETRVGEARKLARIRTFKAQEKEGQRYDANRRPVWYRPSSVEAKKSRDIVHVLRVEPYHEHVAQFTKFSIFLGSKYFFRNSSGCKKVPKVCFLKPSVIMKKHIPP